MKYFIGVRFSVFTKGVKAYEAEDYREKLLNIGRLDYRKEIFKHITLASLDKIRVPDGDSLKVVVMHSDEIDGAIIQDLRESCGDCSTVSVSFVPVSEQERFQDLFSDFIYQSLKFESSETVYASIRLDDDDALSPDYLMRLRKYMDSSFDDFLVSFPLGYTGLWVADEKEWSRISYYYNPKIALGLARIRLWQGTDGLRSSVRNIYQCGNHTQVDQKYTLLMDSSFMAYVRSVHDQNDSNRSKEFIQGFPEVPIEETFLEGGDQCASEVRLKDCDHFEVTVKKLKRRLKALSGHQRTDHK